MAHHIYFGEFNNPRESPRKHENFHIPFPNGIRVTECGREDLGSSQPGEASGKTSNSAEPFTYTHREREIRTTVIWNGEERKTPCGNELHMKRCWLWVKCGRKHLICSRVLRCKITNVDYLLEVVLQVSSNTCLLSP